MKLQYIAISLILGLFLSGSLWAQPTPTPTPEVSPVVSPTPRASETPVQEAPTPAVSESPAPQVTPTPSPAETPAAVERDVPKDFATPESTFEGFMAAMAMASPIRPDQYLIASRFLDLSKLPNVGRNERGIKLSQQLYWIMQSTDLDLSKLEEYQDTKSVTIYKQPSGDTVELVKQEDGRWLFSDSTVHAIPRMYEVLSEKGKIETWYIERLNFDVLGLNANLWLALMLLPFLAYLLGSFVVMLLRIPLGPRVLKKIEISNDRQKLLLKPIGWIAASVFAWLGLSLLDIPPGLLVVLTVIVKVVATISVVTAFFRISDVASIYLSRVTENTSTKIDDMLIPLVRRSLKTIVAIVGILFLAQNLNIEVWSLFAGFSIFGAMVALAGQDMVKNFFGSITVLADQPFAVGDWIVVGTIEGVVEDVGFRSTRVRTFYDSVISLPNSQLITASVDNYGRRNFRRYSKKLSVCRYTSPEKLEAFCEGIRELVRKHPYTRKDSYQVWVNDVNDYAIQILVYVFFSTPDWNTELREKHRFLIDLHRLAGELEVEFAYPSQRLLLTRNEECMVSEFDLERQEAARSKGKEKTQSLLSTSLPEETPPPAVID